MNLIDNGWKGSRLPPLLLTGLGIDVLIGTAGFGIALASCFGHKHEQESWEHSWFGRGIEEISIGFGLGTFLAFVAFIYSKIKIPEFFCSYLVYTASALSMIWCKSHGFAGAASCSTFITWGVVANSWAKHDIERADLKLKTLWVIFKPFLFPVIGAMVSFHDVSVILVAKALVLVGCAVIIKMLATYLTAHFSGFEKAECLFISGVWSGKASIQAKLLITLGDPVWCCDGNGSCTWFRKQYRIPICKTGIFVYGMLNHYWSSFCIQLGAIVWQSSLGT
jgi:hypothetical protein